jgi:hypothetical protein
MEVIMSVGYEHIFKFPPYTENAESWRAMTGDWPDEPWFNHDPRRPSWRTRRALRAGRRHPASPGAKR